MHNVKRQKCYPTIMVEIGNAYFNHLAKHLYGHQVPEIFRRLDVRDQTIFAELELYKLDRIKYEDAIYRLLLAWVRLQTTGATLAILCPILEDTGMKILSEQLLGLAESYYRNSGDQVYQGITRNTHTRPQDNSEIPDRCHTYQFEDEELVKNGEQSDCSVVNEIWKCTIENKTSLDSLVDVSVNRFDTDFVVVERETSL